LRVDATMKTLWRATIAKAWLRQES